MEGALVSLSTCKIVEDGGDSLLESDEPFSTMRVAGFTGEPHPSSEKLDILDVIKELEI